jgi:hypothetical protein
MSWSSALENTWWVSGFIIAVLTCSDLVARLSVRSSHQFSSAPTSRYVCPDFDISMHLKPPIETGCGALFPYWLPVSWVVCVHCTPHKHPTRLLFS